MVTIHLLRCQAPRGSPTCKIVAIDVSISERFKSMIGTGRKLHMKFLGRFRKVLESVASIGLRLNVIAEFLIWSFVATYTQSPPLFNVASSVGRVWRVPV